MATTAQPPSQEAFPGPSSSPSSSSSSSSASSSTPSSKQDCMPCRLLGATVFIGTGAYTAFHGLRDYRTDLAQHRTAAAAAAAARNATASRSLSAAAVPWPIRLRAAGVLGVATSMVGLGVWRLVI